MKSKYLLEKNKYNTGNINKTKIFKFKYDFFKPKDDLKSLSFPKQNKSQNSPIKSDKSRNGGQIIDLEEEKEINEYNTMEKDTICKISDYNGANRNKSINKNNKLNNIYFNLISQRCIDLQIYKGKFNYFLNGAKNLDDKNNKLNIDKYDNKRNIYNITNRLLNKDFYNKYINNKAVNIKHIINSFNSLNGNQFHDGEKIIKIEDNKIKNKSTAYRRKININQKNNKENGTLKNSFCTAGKINSKKLIILNTIKNNRNCSEKKAQTLNNIPETYFEKLNKIKRKIEFQNNNSLFDLFSNKNKINETETLFNHSLEVNDNSNSFYKSLDYFKNSMDEELNNSKIMEKGFSLGMKSEGRKKSLKNAIIVYNRFKSSRKFKRINLYSSSLMPKINKEMKEYINNNYDNKNNNNNNNNEDNNNINNSNNYNDSYNIKEEKENESNFDEDNNQNEFSFNSKYRKKESKEVNNIGEISENYNCNNESISILNPIIIDKLNNNIKEEEIKKEENIKRKKNKHIEEDKVKEEIYKEKIKNYSKILNKSLDNAKNGRNNLIFKSNENSIKNFSVNDTYNDVINKDEYLMKNKNNEKENNIKNKKKNISKPIYFVRKVIREEHYYIDENGKEKLLKVKQQLINDDNKIKKNRTPYIKKNLNAKSPINSKRFKKKEIIKNKNSYFNNYDEKNSVMIGKQLIANKFKKINKSKNKINLTYYHKNTNNQNSLEKGKKMLELEDSNFNKIIHDSILPDSNEFFKDFNDCLFKKNINSFSCISKKEENYEPFKEKENIMIYQKYSNESENKKDNIKNRDKIDLKSKKDKFIKKKEIPVIIRNNNNYKNYLSFERTKITLRKENHFPQNSSNDYINKNDIIFKENEENENIKDFNIISPIKNEKNIENENEDKININQINNYIKVNKMKKFKKINTEEKSMNKNKKFHKRNFYENHAFHEIKSTKNNKNRKNELYCNSQDYYFTNEIPTEDLNKSQRTNEYSVKTLRNERNNGEKLLLINQNLIDQKIFDINKNELKQKNFSKKSNSETFFIVNTRYSNKNKNNEEKKHHRFYESKSTKKKLTDFDIESEGKIGRFNNYYTNFEKYNASIISKNDIKDKFLYQNLRENGNYSAYQYNINLQE